MVYNFGAGPSMLPHDVLLSAQKNLCDFEGNGLSIMEASHRSPLYENVHNQAISDIRKLYNVPEDFDVLFLQGGASLQFAMVPMNLYKGGVIEFADTGVWSTKAIKEAKILGYNYKIVATSKESGYDHIPEVKFSDSADYAYITTNNTIYGTQYRSLPKTNSPLVVDASSDVFSYEIDWNNVDCLFAGAQKNAGPSGVTLVIIRKSLLENVGENIPSMLRYKIHAEANSLYNTPPTFGIYLLGLTMKWIESQGGIKAIQEYNAKKAAILYKAIDESDGFYLGHARAQDRSHMNITFTIHDTNLEAKLLEKAKNANMIGLKGHRSVGGLRASIYNAMRLEGVEALASLMQDFAKANR
jgi:phosphoserine aminotransferase